MRATPEICANPERRFDVKESSPRLAASPSEARGEWHLDE
jgi:hypothetical protein